MIHALRPFPAVGLPILERFAKLGRRRQHPCSVTPRRIAVAGEIERVAR